MPAVSKCCRFRLPAAAVALCLALPTVAAAVEDPTYRALRDARPDGRRLALTGPLEIERDAFRFRFDSGAFHFLAPVDGRTVGAVFVGQGSYRLHPAAEHERRHLAFLTGEAGLEVLSDTFDRLVTLFADDTFAELGLAGAVQAAASDPAAVKAYEEALRWQRKDFRVNLHARLLEDLLNTPGLTSGVFFALVDGNELPPALAAVDPRGLEALGLVPLGGGEDTYLYLADDTRGGLWYASHRRAELAAARPSPYEPLADALHYAVDTTIENNTDVRGETVVRLESKAPALRVLPVGLLPTLRISAAAYRGEGEESWREAAWVQEHEDEDAAAAVVLPTPVPAGGRLELRLTYAGDEVLTDRGGGNYAVGARASWYANLGVFSDPATFDLTYRVPERDEVVSVGEPAGVESAGGRSVSRWQAAEPIQVAGFNYGRFKRTERRDKQSDLEVRVYTNPGTPDIIREINAALSGGRGTLSDLSLGGDEASALDVVTGPNLGRINTERLAESALVDGLNAARVGHVYFGPLPQGHVAITQQEQWGFGQSWPQLIFMPYLAFLTSTQRVQMGIGGIGSENIEHVGYHEMAHQWWGHLVGWESYRDQWLCEGFAEFSAALVLQHTSGWEAAGRFWDQSRDFITARLRSPVPSYEVGPITQGLRLATHKSPAAYSALVYSKGAYVLHMLRMLMWDPAAPEPDHRFIAMMRDFTSTYAGRAPSTADFQAVVERHMVPAMNATGDGRMSWFFDQWVYGTEIPDLTAKLDVAKAGKDKYRVTGEVTLAEVSSGFRVLVPLYVELGRGEMASFGLLPFAGPGTRQVDVTLELPKKPRRALINARREVLTRR